MIHAVRIEFWWPEWRLIVVSMLTGLAGFLLGWVLAKVVRWDDEP